jgi:N-methylhydantoinase B/oxoprolinase/acetone carboxylase alpha subunit
MSSQRTYDTALVLRAPATISASENCTPLTPIYPDKVDEAIVVVSVTSITGTTPTATFALQASNDGGNTWITLAQIGPISAIGRYEMAWSGIGATALCPGSDRVRLSTTLGGTSPSITYQSFLAKED